MERQTLNHEAKGFTRDRVTVVVKGHYQEVEPPLITSATHAFDYSNPEACDPFQTVQKIGPSGRAPINIGSCEWGKCLLILSHDPIKISKEAGKGLKEAMESNKITLTNEDGVVVGILRHRFSCVVEYPFPVFAVSDSATALLSVTAYPIVG